MGNMNKLKGKIVEKGFSIKSLSEQVDISETSLRRKMKMNSDFSLNETMKIKNVLDLSSEEYVDIFFGTELELNSENKSKVELKLRRNY